MSHILNLLFHIFKSDYLLNIGRDIGDRKKPTVILLHGIAANSSIWNKMIEDLSDKYRIISIDLLGFGDSPKPKNSNYSVDDHVRSLRKTIKKLKVKGKYSIVGHSMGSIIATRYVSYYQREMKHVYLMSMPIYQKNDRDKSRFLNKKIDAFLKMYEVLLKNKKFTLSIASRFKLIFSVYGSFNIDEENWHSFRLSLINTIIKQNTLSDILKIKIPIDIVYGTIDPLLVQENLNTIGKNNNVRITKIAFVSHVIDNRFAKAMAEVIGD